MASFYNEGTVFNTAQSDAALRALFSALDTALLAVGCTLVPNYAQTEINDVVYVSNTSAFFIARGTRVYEINDSFSTEHPIYLQVDVGTIKLWMTSDRPYLRLTVSHHQSANGNAYARHYARSVVGAWSSSGGATHASPLPTFAVKKDGVFAVSVAHGLYASSHASYPTRLPAGFIALQREFDAVGNYLGISVCTHTTSVPSTANASVGTVTDRLTQEFRLAFLDPAITALTPASDYFGCVNMAGWPERAIVNGRVGLWLPTATAGSSRPFTPIAFYRGDLAVSGEYLDAQIGERVVRYRALGIGGGFVPHMSRYELDSSFGTCMAMEWDDADD